MNTINIMIAPLSPIFGKSSILGRKFASCASALAILTLVALPANAELITYNVLNASFEDPALANPGDLSFSIPSWVGSASLGAFRVAYRPETSNFDQPVVGLDGLNVFSAAAANNGAQSWVTQDITGSELLAEAGRTYTMTVNAGRYLNIGTDGLSLSLAIGTTSLGFGQSLALVTYAPGTIPIGSLGEFSVSYTSTGAEAQIGEGLRIWIVAEQLAPTTGDTWNLAVDDVRFFCIPEPSTWAFLGLGLAALVTFRHRRVHA